MVGSSRNPLPAGTQVILSVKTVDGDLTSFLDSLDAKTVNRIVFQHEPERPGLFASGSEFTAAFDAAAAARIDVVRDDVDWARTHGFFAYSYFLSEQGPDGYNWLDSSLDLAAMNRSLERG